MALGLDMNENCVFTYQATLKKSLFPVQRVADIVASLESTKSLFLSFFDIFFYKEIVKIIF